MYYVSSYALCVIEKIFKNQNSPIDISFYKQNKFKYHILLVLRILVCGFNYPHFTSNEMKKYSEKLYTVLVDKQKSIEYIKLSLQIISDTIKIYNNHNKTYREPVYKLHRTKNFTFDLIEIAKRCQGRQ